VFRGSAGQKRVQLREVLAAVLAIGKRQVCRGLIQTGYWRQSLPLAAVKEATEFPPGVCVHGGGDAGEMEFKCVSRAIGEKAACERMPCRWSALKAPS